MGVFGEAGKRPVGLRGDGSLVIVYSQQADLEFQAASVLSAQVGILYDPRQNKLTIL